MLSSFVPAVLAYPANGTQVGTVTFSQNCASGVGVGITFDGTYLWISCFRSNPDLLRANPKTGLITATYDIEGGLGALAYDKVHNGIWAAPGGGSYSSSVMAIQLNSLHSVTASKVAFGPVPNPSGIVDGLALDGSTNTLYYSPDVSTTIYVYTESGTLVRSFAWSGSGCYNSGLGLGGNLLFEGSDGCDHVWVVDKNTLAPAFNFATGGLRDESLTCDDKTFAPVTVIWSKDAYDPNQAFAFAIPLGSCGVGGGTAGGPVFPLSWPFGFSAIHSPSPGFVWVWP